MPAHSEKRENAKKMAFYAADHGDIETVKKWLDSSEFQADIYELDEYGFNLVEVAAKGGHVALTELLINHYEGKITQRLPRDAYPVTIQPLLSEATLLLPIHVLQRKIYNTPLNDIDINCVDHQDNTLLHLLIINSNLATNERIERLELLFKQGINPTLRNKDGLNAFNLALLHQDEAFTYRVIDYTYQYQQKTHASYIPLNVKQALIHLQRIYLDILEQLIHHYTALRMALNNFSFSSPFVLDTLLPVDHLHPEIDKQLSWLCDLESECRAKPLNTLKPSEIFNRVKTFAHQIKIKDIECFQAKTRLEEAALTGVYLIQAQSSNPSAFFSQARISTTTQKAIPSSRMVLT